jgi:hypothetical protein
MNWEYVCFIELMDWEYVCFVELMDWEYVCFIEVMDWEYMEWEYCEHKHRILVIGRPDLPMMKGDNENFNASFSTNLQETMPMTRR